MKKYTVMVSWMEGSKRKEYTIRNIYAETNSDARILAENHSVLKNKIGPTISCLWYDHPQPKNT